VYDNSAIGESCYRLMTRTGQFIYLKTRGYLEVDNLSNKAHSFVCINSLVSEEEGKKLVREMKKNFSVLVNSTSDLAIESDVPTVENPHEIERAILNLITNLQPGESEVVETVDVKPEVVIRKPDLDDDSSQPRTTKSPPLLIIAPSTSTIKTTISKSMAIVETNKGVMVAAEHIIKLDSDEDNSMRPSVLQRTATFKSVGNGSHQFYQNQQQLFEYDFNHEIKTEPSSSPMPIKHESHLMSPLSIGPDSPMLYSGEEQYGHPLHAASSMNYGYQDASSRAPAYNSQLGSPPFYSQTHYVEDESISSCGNMRPQMKRGHESYGPLESVKKRHTDTENAMLPLRDLNNSTKAGECLYRGKARVRKTVLMIFFVSDLIHALPKSFEALDRSLADIEDATCTLKEQCNTYAVDSHKQKINEIIVSDQFWWK
jgi:PAS domain